MHSYVHRAQTGIACLPRPRPSSPAFTPSIPRPRPAFTPPLIKCYSNKIHQNSAHQISCMHYLLKFHTPSNFCIIRYC